MHYCRTIDDVFLPLVVSDGRNPSELNRSSQKETIQLHSNTGSNNRQLSNSLELRIEMVISVCNVSPYQKVLRCHNYSMNYLHVSNTLTLTHMCRLCFKEKKGAAVCCHCINEV